MSAWSQLGSELSDLNDWIIDQFKDHVAIAIRVSLAESPTTSEWPLCASRHRNHLQVQLRPWAKTLSSEDYVPLPKRLAVELMEWRGLTPTPGPEDFIFPNACGGFLDYENFEARVLDPIRIKLSLSKLNFQILRRDLRDTCRW